MILLGSSYTAQLDVFDQNGNPANCATITLTITQPDGTTAAPTVANPPAVTGQYSGVFLPVQAGRHTVYWLTTGPNTSYADVFDVLPPAPMGIVSLSDTKRQLGIDPTETDDDDELLSWIGALTDPVEKFKNEVVVYRQFTDTFEARHASRFRSFKLPVVTLDSLTCTMWGQVYDLVTSPIPAGQLGSTYPWYIDPETGLARMVLPGQQLSGMVTAVTHAGYTIMPQHVANACMMLLQELWAVRRGPGGVGGVIGPEELGRYTSTQVLPRKVRETLGSPRPVVC